MGLIDLNTTKEDETASSGSSSTSSSSFFVAGLNTSGVSGSNLVVGASASASATRRRFGTGLGSEMSTDAYLRSVELKLRTWVFFCGDHALRPRLTSARRSTARKLTVAAKTMRRRMLNRGRTERFCGCGSFMGFAKDDYLYGLIFVGSVSDPLSFSALGVFLDIGRDGMLKD